MKKIINYQGVKFDSFIKESKGKKKRYWTNICPACAEKFKHAINFETDYNSQTGGICGVLNCSYNPDSDGGFTHCLDFAPEHIKIEDFDD